MPEPRLVRTPGSLCVATADGLLLQTPEEEIYRVGASPELTAAALAAWTGASLTALLDEHAELNDFVALLTDTRSATTTPSPQVGLSVLLIAQPAWESDLLASALTDAGHQVTRITPDAFRPPDQFGRSDALTPAAERVDLLLGLAPRIDDPTWSRLALTARAEDTGSCVLHREGMTWYLGPYARRTGAAGQAVGAESPGPTGRDADYLDLRTRRLAASPCPDDLAEVWQRAAEMTTGARDADLLGSAIDSLLDDLNADVCGRRPSAVNTQLGFSPQARHRHPVLPVPYGRYAPPDLLGTCGGDPSDDLLDREPPLAVAR